MIIKNKVIWFRHFRNFIADSVFAFMFTVVGYAFVLYFCKMLWAAYSETTVGEMFTQSNEVLYMAIDEVMCQNLFVYSFLVSLTAVQACLIIGFVAHISCLKRLFYDPYGFLGCMVFSGLPCAVGTAFYFQPTNPMISFVVCFLPTMALFSYCFEFVARLVPDTEVLLRKIFGSKKN